eukprot:6182840-Pleurochrysis_carterae.AAC.1
MYGASVCVRSYFCASLLSFSILLRKPPVSRSAHSRSASACQCKVPTLQEPAQKWKVAII